ncbi:MAG: energy-coupling factor ABC transporter permease [Muribaculaceae bacterium]|nr:energy-coupling factor ABC transporter permease [Muribaculaceae bacterium]
MHVSDALISPPVAIVGGLISISLIALASKKAKQDSSQQIIPLMGVMGAFVFAAQMINFSIPGTGSSGHLIGGIFLSAILGPWCAFITLCSILIVQCLIFADGGLLALGCNIFNMAATSCLIAYPLIYKPIVNNSLNPFKLTLGAIVSSIIALEIGAFAVTLETEASGITALPFSTFIKFMIPIHLVIGLIEGLVTASLILFISKRSPSILFNKNINAGTKARPYKGIITVFGIITLVLAAGFTVLASENPDGLEWSIAKVAGLTEFVSEAPSTAIMPEYDSNYAGILGAVIVMMLLWGISGILFSRLKHSKSE